MDSGSAGPHISCDCFSTLHSSFCEIVHGLQVHPKLGAGAIEARQAQSSVCCHCPLALNDGAYARRRNPQSDRQALTDIPSGLRNSSFSTSPGWAVTRLGVAMALVVVDDFNIGRSFFGPSETDAPLIVDPDGMLSPTAAGQRL